MFFHAKSFCRDVEAHLDKAQSSLIWLIKAYCWASNNEKTIRKYWEGYTNGWLQTEISRVFNINAEVYVRTAKRFGNGEDEAALDRGIAIANKYGVWECFRAEKDLAPQLIQEVVEKLTPKTGIEAFRALIANARTKQKQIERAQVESSKSLRYKRRISVEDNIDYKDLYEKEKARCEQLERELAAALARLEKIQQAIAC